MSDKIKVYVVKTPGSNKLVARWRDATTRRWKQESTETNRRREAQKVAAKKEAELNEGRYVKPSRIKWSDFCELYGRQKLSGLADGTEARVLATFNWVARLPGFDQPDALLADLTAKRISDLLPKMRDAGLAETTIKTHVGQLAAALRWAERQGHLTKAPAVELPKRDKASRIMKGRPISEAEFEMVLAAVPKVLDSCTRGGKPLPADRAAVRSWRYLLRGLWLSGLRLREALELRWDGDLGLRVELGLPGDRPMLRIPAASEKGHKDRLLPMAPEFAEFLLETPERQRKGPVFNPAARRVHADRLGWQVVSAVICRIGRAAGIKVAAEARGDRIKVKYASAHDFRRSFGERWASRIMPVQLKELMRHESLDTTLKYYVGQNAQRTAEILWAAYEKEKGDKSASVLPMVRKAR